MARNWAQQSGFVRFGVLYGVALVFLIFFFKVGDIFVKRKLHWRIAKVLILSIMQGDRSQKYGVQRTEYLYTGHHLGSLYGFAAGHKGQEKRSQHPAGCRTSQQPDRFQAMGGNGMLARLVPLSYTAFQGRSTLFFLP